MSALVLHTAIGSYSHLQPLHDGRVTSPRLRLEHTHVEPITRAFRRMARGLEFDLCEMALTTHAIAHSLGKPFTALPIVVVGEFHHRKLFRHRGSTIPDVRDLIGKRIGVRAYTQTTGVWVRGLLAEEHGIARDAMRWVVQEDSHVAEFVDPAHVVRGPEGLSLPAMLEAGVIDALVALHNPDPARFEPAIPGADSAALARHRCTGDYPVNHVIVLRDALIAEHPWLVGELVEMFAAARALAAPPEGGLDAFAHILATPDPRQGLGPYASGIRTLLRFAHEDGLTPRAYHPEELVTPWKEH